MQITWLIGHSCKCGNILRRVILIGRGLFLVEIEKISKRKYQEKQKTEMIKLILCSNQRTEVREINPNFDKTG